MAASQIPPASSPEGEGAAQGVLEISTEGEDDPGEAFDFEDSEEEEEEEEEQDSTRLVVSSARTELGTRGALQDPPLRRRSSISDDLEPADDWDAEEALLEDRVPLTPSDSGTSLADPFGSQMQAEFLGAVSNGDVGIPQAGTRIYSWKRKSFRQGGQFAPTAADDVIYDDVPDENVELDQRDSETNLIYEDVHQDKDPTEAENLGWSSSEFESYSEDSGDENKPEAEPAKPKVSFQPKEDA